MTAEEIRGALQAILFVAGEPVSIDQLSDALGGEPREAIEAQLQALRQSCDESSSGLALELTAGGYRFATRPAFDPFLRKFFARQSESRLSMAGLETLAIVAYRQPITAPEINEIRGVNSSGVLRTLLDRHMVRIAGRKPVVGSPFLYRTTREFLVHFGLNTIQDLPRLEEFSEMLGVNLPEELVLPDEIPVEREDSDDAAAADAGANRRLDAFADQEGDGSLEDERDSDAEAASAADASDARRHEEATELDLGEDRSSESTVAEPASSTDDGSEADRKPVESMANDQD